MEFDKKCRVSLSPKKVLLPIPPSRRAEKRSSKGKPRRRDELLIIEDNDFTEIRFSRFRSASCKHASLRHLELDSGVEPRQLRRCSVYQTSGEIRSIKQPGAEGLRSKIEISHSGDKYVSVRNVPSLCSYNTSISPPNKFQINPNGGPCSSDDSIRNKEVLSSMLKLSMQGEPVSDPNCGFEHVAGPLIDAKCSLDKNMCRSLHKSVSVKVEIQQSPHKSSMESRFSSIKKIIDPFMKSMSHKSPLVYDLGFGESRKTEMVNVSDGFSRESLLSGTADKPPHNNLDTDSHFVENDCCHLAKACSLTDLQGCLKLKKVNGAAVFEFSLKSPEDIFVAKTWNTKNADSWVYTFHTKLNRKHSNASARGLKVSENMDATIVGQMHVSSYLHSEYGDNDVGDTLTTEFMLYDIAHANRCVPTQESLGSSIASPDTFRLSKGPVRSAVEDKLKSDNLAAHEKLMPTLKHASDLNLWDPISYPWAPAYLHPNLEVAAIIIQVPFEKRESLKHGNAENFKEMGYIHAKRRTQFRPTVRSPKINVVASAGNHSLPDAESQGPSPLLSRWRSGGGCECGGWDMMCPLIVLNNGTDSWKGSHLPLIMKNIPMELFVQGLKEDMPALSMTAVEEGHYSVDFHARLSGLQAFSICIAMLHSSEISPATRNNQNMSTTLPNTLKMFLEDDVEILIEPIRDISKKKTITSLPTTEAKTRATRTRKETSSFTFNPPFSPISRA